MRKRARLLPFVLSLVLAASARADYRSLFREGYAAFARRNWSVVEERMSAAIGENPKEDAGTLVRVGGTFVKAYVPSFYLGYAQAELGRCREAISTFDRVERGGQLKGLPEESDLVEIRNRCRGKLLAGVKDRTEKLLAQAAESRKRVATSESRRVLSEIWANERSLGGEERRLEETANSLRTELAAIRAPDQYPRAEKMELEAASLLAGWEALTETARRRRETVEQERIAASRSAPEARKQEPATKVAERKDVGAEREAVPRELVAAISAYFAGNYSGCLSSLKEVRSRAPKVAAEVELFQAAAKFALSRTSETASPAILNEARAAVTRYKKLAGDSAPSQEYFSPEFLAFFSSGS